MEKVLSGIPKYRENTTEWRIFFPKQQHTQPTHITRPNVRQGLRGYKVLLDRLGLEVRL